MKCKFSFLLILLCFLLTSCVGVQGVVILNENDSIAYIYPNNISEVLDKEATDEKIVETENTSGAESISSTEKTNAGQDIDVINDPELTLKVHFIDVGQADCILVQSDDETMLIDAGNNADSKLILDYLDSLNIEKLDYVIGTHPHEDHIGSLDSVINRYGIGKIYMPKVSSTTKTFKDVLLAIKERGMKVTTPVVGSTFDLGKATCTIVAPNCGSYRNLNNYSVVIKMVYGNTSFLFTGDAEKISEKEILENGLDINADVLKVGHHGSGSSTSQEFLNAVSPEYAIISVGKDNDYGHPHAEALDRLQSSNVEIYRTDEAGTIIATSDGSKIVFEKMAPQVKPQAPPADTAAKTGK